MEAPDPYDLNEVADTVLAVLFEYGGDRKISLTTFNPDMAIV